MGALIILYGVSEPYPPGYYVSGGILMLLTAIYYKLTYFIALEIILIAGHGAVLLGIGPTAQVVLPILLCLQLLFYYVLSGQLKNVFRFIGILGIGFLSIAFLYQNPWIFFFGSLGIAVFSFYQVYRGRHIALLWALLNLIFVFISVYKIL